MDLRTDEEFFCSSSPKPIKLPSQIRGNNKEGIDNKKFILDDVYKIYCQLCNSYDGHTIFICPKLKQNKYKKNE